MAPSRIEGRVYYTFGLTRESVMGLVLLTSMSMILISVLIYAYFSVGMSRILQYMGGVFWCGLVFALILYLIGTNIWMIYSARKQSQVCVWVETGQAQVQYSHKLSSAASSGTIRVVTAGLKKANETGRYGYVGWIMKKLERKDVHLVVIRTQLDFEIVGAFKALNSAFDFAEKVQFETGLEVEEESMPELQTVEGHRSYGLGSKDTKAMNQRFRSRPFNAG